MRDLGRTSPSPDEWPDVERLVARASEDVNGVPAELLHGYLEVLADISLTSRKLDQDQLRERRDVGARAAERGVPIRSVIDLYLSATWMAWPSLPGVRQANGAEAFSRVGQAVFRAADAAIIAVAEGYEEAQRWSLRQEETFRREFVDDLLDGRNLDQLAERAERYGLRLAGTHVVSVAGGAESFVDGGKVARQVEAALHFRLGSRDVLVTTKDGLLVCVAPDTFAATEEFVRHTADALGPDGVWRVGIGRPQPGPGGAVRSFEQAKYAMDIADRLRLPGHVHKASDLLVYQVLLRDRSALADLVHEVLEPLRAARGGAKPLLDTLDTYFAVGRISTAAARELHIGVRTVTYRLQRVRSLTGYAAEDPQDGFTLQVAVLGAQLLGWPDSDQPS